ncbi:MAG TPA: HAD family hydrolase [Candidatus Eisenbacteria bacterium]|nr:HAD family hydrolase [Candidatus Eisenbacteria bacterium]
MLAATAAGESRKDSTEGALVVLAAKAGFKRADLDARFPRVHEIPFSSEARRMTTLHRSSSGLVAYAKGAPEVIVASCAWQLTGAAEEPLDQHGRELILQEARNMARQALRVIAVAYKDNAAAESAEREMVFLGLVGLIDPPRPEARLAIRRCEQAGIKPIMITGDHPVTAEAVARELELLKNGRVISGSELHGMTDQELERQVENISV